MRATSVFQHPILFGTLTAIFFPFALIAFLRIRSWMNGLGLFGVVLSMLMTLSSAPLLSLIFQGAGALLVKFWDSARRLWMPSFSAVWPVPADQCRLQPGLFWHPDFLPDL
ncbi:MAG: hypothetical protein R3E89_02820 [Thiolinea sp.]